MDGEWHSALPDGRRVEVRREGEYWVVTCGESRERSDNLDVALARVLRAEIGTEVHAHKFDYPTWIRHAADELTPDE